MNQQANSEVLPAGRTEAPRTNACSGLTLLEVCITTVVIAALFLGLAGTIRTNFLAVGSAERMERAALFLETTMENVSGQPYANLLVMNGDRLFDGQDLAQSDFAVDLTVFPAGVDVVQLRAALTDLQSGRELGRVTTLRCMR